jgi:pimeloyl-ACP methyl ester carboxylesterase
MRGRSVRSARLRWLTTRAVWNDTVAAFAGCYRVHSVQVRGFGDDPGINASGPVLDPLVTELAEYIDAEIIRKGAAPPMIVGHSVGGLAGLKLAHSRPELVARLVMVDSLPAFSATIPGLPPERPEAVEPIAAQMRSVIAATYGKPVDPVITEVNVKDLVLDPAGLAKLKTWSAAADPRVVAQVIYEDLVTDMRPKLAEVKTPITVLAAWHGTMPFTEPQVQRFFERQFTGAVAVSVTTIPQAAHFIMLDQPEQFRRALEAFLANRDQPVAASR